MTILGNFIYDFLDKEPHDRSAGTYSFESSQVTFLNEISEDKYFYKVRRVATDTVYGIVDIAIRDFEVKEVFSTDRATPATYVKRVHGPISSYEATLSLAISDPGSTIVMYGPSKLGKSALWRYSMEMGSEALVLQCTPNFSIENLYNTALYKLKSSHISKTTDSTSDKQTERIDVATKIGPSFAQGGIEYGTNSEHLEGTDTTRQYPEQPMNADIVGEELSKKNMALVFENFHRLKKDIFEELCFDIRTFSDYRVTTILVGIPDDPFEITRINNELTGRAIFLSFDFWDPKDLWQIAIGGAGALNIEFSDETLSLITTEAGGSPLLMQLYCLLACLSSNITEAHKTDSPIPVADMSSIDFKRAMQKYISNILAPYKPICDALQEASTKYASIPDDFAKKFFEYLKIQDPDLSIDYSNLGLPPLTKTGIKTLSNYLNRNPDTHDLMMIDMDSCKITICNPLFIAYVRWIHDD